MQENIKDTWTDPIEESLTMGERIATILPFVLLGSVIVFWAIPSAIGMISGNPKTTRLNLDDKIVYAIGAAEGTRTCDGGKTEAYSKHLDPSDGKANGGTFSAAPRGNGITATMTPEERDIAFLGNINTALKSIDTSKMSKLEVATFADLYVQAHPEVSAKFVKAGGANIVSRRVEAFHSNGRNESWTTTARLTKDQQRRHDRISKCLA